MIARISYTIIPSVCIVIRRVMVVIGRMRSVSLCKVRGANCCAVSSITRIRGITRITIVAESRSKRRLGLGTMIINSYDIRIFLHKLNFYLPC